MSTKAQSISCYVCLKPTREDGLDDEVCNPVPDPVDLEHLEAGLPQLLPQALQPPLVSVPLARVQVEDEVAGVL